MKTALITGSAGLIGAEACRFLAEKGYRIVGIDNDMRKEFFGAEASTDWRSMSASA
jgi:CDP-paratose 2-epimerase